MSSAQQRLDEMSSAERLAMDEEMSAPAGWGECGGQATGTPMPFRFVETDDANPKAAIGALKVPLHLVPPSAKHFLALALEDGAKKYGPYNWRKTGISISTYKGAFERHWDAFWDGEDFASDSGKHHIAHAMACCAILLDAMTVGKLIDDRPPAGAASRLQAEYLAEVSK